MLGPSSKASASASASAILERLKNATPLIESLMKIAGTPGVSVGVLYHGEVVLCTGYGYSHVARSIPATGKTVYPLASMSKAFASAACGLLVSDGKLSWDTPIAEYIPTFNPSGDPKIRECASIVDALSHATGLKDVSSLYLGVDGSTLFVNGEQTIRTINNLPITEGEFRKVWRYNGLMYGLIGLIIEKLSGMHSTSMIFSDPAKRTLHKDELATPYMVMANGFLKDIPISEYGYGTPLAIGCGLQSSAEDLLKWSTVIIDSYRRIHGLETLKGNEYTTLREMEKILSPVCTLPTSLGGSASYCLGWFLMRGEFIFDDIFDQLMERPVDTEKPDLGYPAVATDQPRRTIIFHSGLFHGYSSTIHLYPETCDAVIVLGNSTGRGDAVDWISRLLTAIVCGDEPSPRLEDLLREEGEGQQRIWDIMEKEWSSRRDHTELALASAERIIGSYYNEELGMKIHIFNGNRDPRDDATVSCPQLYVSFHHDKSHRLALHHYRDSIFSFFPSKTEFQERLVWQLHDFTQFLLHVDLPDSMGRASGLWWQFERISDGIWFALEEVTE